MVRKRGLGPAGCQDEEADEESTGLGAGFAVGVWDGGSGVYCCLDQ